MKSKSKRKPAKKAAPPRERKHKRTHRHPAVVSMMANVDFSRAPSLAEAMGLQSPQPRGVGQIVKVNGVRTDAPNLRPDQTAPLFPCTRDGQEVIVSAPVAVCESGQARIMGREWGPDSRGKGKGWVYLLLDAKQRFGGVRFLATEEELVKWTRSA